MVFSGHRIQDGDETGILVDMEKKLLYFYQNNMRVDTPISLKWLDKDLYIACLLNGSQLKLTYRGRRTPDSYAGQT